MIIKKFFALTSAVSLMFMSVYGTDITLSAEETEDIYLHGDLDFNSNIDIADYVLLNSFVLNEFEEETLKKQSADLNEDGNTDSLDILIMQQYMHGIIEEMPARYFIITPDKPDVPQEPDGPETLSPQLIPSSVADANACTQSVGEAKALVFFVEFSDAWYGADKLSEEQLQQEFFGQGVTAYPYESISAYIDRSSFGNMQVSGDVFYCRLDGSINDYSSEQGREKLVMDVMKKFDERIDYSDYDADHDGDIDVFSFTVPLDNTSDDLKSFWYGATHTWYYNQYYSADNVKIDKFIGNDVMPYTDDMYYLKQTFLHELGHSMGLPDIYKYSSSDYEGLKGNAGFCRMDDSIGDYCAFSKLMLGWLNDEQVMCYDRNIGGTQEFELQSTSLTGNCILLPVNNWNGSYTDEYFLIEYITDDLNDYDVRNWMNGWWSEKYNSGIRIMHVNSKMFADYWGRKDFMYENYSEMYRGDDRERVLRLVNSESKGYYKSGEEINTLMLYDSDGYETVQSGYTVYLIEETDRKFRISISCNH